MCYKTLLLWLILPVLMSGCAGVKVYSDANLKHEAAIKVHLPKPFLLVEYGPAKDVAIKATIVFLPDLSESLYFKTKNGIGTSNLTLNLDKGYLSQYGAVTDSKTPETITAVATGLAALLPFAIPSGTATEAMGAVLHAGDAKDLTNLKKILKNIKKDIEASDTTEMSTNQIDARNELLNQLQKAIDIAAVLKPVLEAELYKVLQGCEKQFWSLLFAKPQSEDKKKRNEEFLQFKTELEAGMATLKPMESHSPLIELYEILYDKTNGYSLKRINLK